MPYISLDVIAPLLIDFSHCSQCEQIFAQAGLGGVVRDQQRQEYPDEFRKDAARLAEWIDALADRFSGQVRIRLIDPQSPEGLLKSVRHWIREYPTFVIDGREKISGWDRAELETALGRRLPPSGK